MNMATYDFIVVGSGSAGGTLAGRLAEDSAHRVLMLEAGGGNRHLMVRVPIAWHAASEVPKFTWGYETAPEENTGNRILAQPCGHLLGGSSSINGMMYSRGNKGDYDEWAQLGLTGWSYAEVLPYFRKAEANWRGETPYHGGSGPFTVSRNPCDPLVYPAMIAAAKKLGFEELDDFHGPSQEGFGMPDFSVRRGERESSVTAFVDPVAGRKNLTVATGAQVLRILFDGKRAIGVEYRQNGRVKQAHAHEIIVSAGAFNSPRLLLLSGIGPADELSALGIEPLRDLPAVGRNLQDHPLVPAVFQAAGELSFDRMLRLDRLGISCLQWALTKSGPLTSAPLSVQAYVRTQAESDRPDTQFQVSHVSFLARPWFPGWRKGAGHQFTAAAMQLRPEGRGSVTLRSKDPAVPPVIRLGLLSTEKDRQAARDMLDFIRDFFATEPVASLVAKELLPGTGDRSKAEVDAYLRNTIQTGSHPASTCAMGTDPASSVVDAQLRVRGIEGLRIADTSVMPRIVSGNTSAPAIMIAEKAADLILGRPALPPARDLPAPLSEVSGRSKQAAHR